MESRDTSGSTGQLSSGGGSTSGGGGGMHHSHSTPAGVDGGARTPPATPKKGGKMLAIRVQMLDDTITIFQVQAKAMGQVLFDQVCKQLHLLEADYFGLEYQDLAGTRYWLDLQKPISRQLGLSLVDPLLYFCVKFYTPDPGQLEEEYTRYLYCLQVKRDLSQGLMHCNDNTAALMASYIVQAECGDYVSEDYPDHTYLSSYKFVPHQDQEMERKIMENHKKHAGQSPAEADLNLLETARRCELYGIKMHPAKDHENVPLNLAVAHMGIVVYQQITKINTFSWAKIRKLSFKRKKFLIKLHPEGYGYYKDTVEFFFEGRNECKNFWKKCVENHGFFRYSGKTQKQMVEFVRDNYVKRQTFQRSASFRHSSAHSSANNMHTSSVGNSISAHPLLPLADSNLSVEVSKLSASLGAMGGPEAPISPTTRSAFLPRVTPMSWSSAPDTRPTTLPAQTTNSPSPPLTTQSVSPITSATTSPQHIPYENTTHSSPVAVLAAVHRADTGIITTTTRTPSNRPPSQTQSQNDLDNTNTCPDILPKRHIWQRSSSCRELYDFSFEDSGQAKRRIKPESARVNLEERKLESPITRYDDHRSIYGNSCNTSLEIHQSDQKVYSSSYPGTTSYSQESVEDPGNYELRDSQDDLSHDSYELLERSDDDYSTSGDYKYAKPKNVSNTRSCSLDSGNYLPSDSDSEKCKSSGDVAQDIFQMEDPRDLPREIIPRKSDGSYYKTFKSSSRTSSLDSNEPKVVKPVKPRRSISSRTSSQESKSDYEVSKKTSRRSSLAKKSSQESRTTSVESKSEYYDVDSEPKQKYQHEFDRKIQFERNYGTQKTQGKQENGVVDNSESGFRETSHVHSISLQNVETEQNIRANRMAHLEQNTVPRTQKSAHLRSQTSLEGEKKITHIWPESIAGVPTQLQDWTSKQSGNSTQDWASKQTQDWNAKQSGNSTQDWSLKETGNSTQDWATKQLQDWNVIQSGNSTQDWAPMQTQDWNAKQSGNSTQDWASKQTQDWNTNSTQDWSGNSTTQDWNKQQSANGAQDWGTSQSANLVGSTKTQSNKDWAAKQSANRSTESESNIFSFDEDKIKSLEESDDPGYAVVPNIEIKKNYRDVFVEIEPRKLDLTKDPLILHQPIERTKSDPNNLAWQRLNSNSRRMLLRHQKSIDLTPAESSDEDYLYKQIPSAPPIMKYRGTHFEMPTAEFGHFDILKREVEGQKTKFEVPKRQFEILGAKTQSDFINLPPKNDSDIPYVLHKRHIMNGTSKEEVVESRRIPPEVPEFITTTEKSPSAEEPETGGAFLFTQNIDLSKVDPVTLEIDKSAKPIQHLSSPKRDITRIDPALLETLNSKLSQIESDSPTSSKTESLKPQQTIKALHATMEENRQKLEAVKQKISPTIIEPQERKIKTDIKPKRVIKPRMQPGKKGKSNKTKVRITSFSSDDESLDSDDVFGSAEATPTKLEFSPPQMRKEMESILKYESERKYLQYTMSSTEVEGSPPTTRKCDNLYERSSELTQSELRRISERSLSIPSSEDDFNIKTADLQPVFEPDADDITLTLETLEEVDREVDKSVDDTVEQITVQEFLKEDDLREIDEEKEKEKKKLIEDIEKDIQDLKVPAKTKITEICSPSMRKKGQSPLLFAHARLNLSEGSAFSLLQKQQALESPVAGRRAKSLDTPVISVSRLPPLNSFSSKDDTVEEEDNITDKMKDSDEFMSSQNVSFDLPKQESAIIEEDELDLMDESRIMDGTKIVSVKSAEELSRRKVEDSDRGEDLSRGIGEEGNRGKGDATKIVRVKSKVEGAEESSRGIVDDSSRARGEDSGNRGRGEDSGRGIREDSARERGEDLGRRKGDASKIVRLKSKEEGSEESSRAIVNDPSRGRGEDSIRGKGKNSGSGMHEDSDRGIREDSDRGTGEDSDKGYGEDSTRGKVEDSIRGKVEDSIRAKAVDSARGKPEDSSRTKVEDARRGSRTKEEDSKKLAKEDPSKSKSNELARTTRAKIETTRNKVEIVKAKTEATKTKAAPKPKLGDQPKPKPEAKPKLTLKDKQKSVEKDQIVPDVVTVKTKRYITKTAAAKSKPAARTTSKPPAKPVKIIAQKTTVERSVQPPKTLSLDLTEKEEAKSPISEKTLPTQASLQLPEIKRTKSQELESCKRPTTKEKAKSLEKLEFKRTGSKERTKSQDESDTDIAKRKEYQQMLYETAIKQTKTVKSPVKDILPVFPQVEEMVRERGGKLEISINTIENTGVNLEEAIIITKSPKKLDKKLLDQKLTKSLEIALGDEDEVKSVQRLGKSLDLETTTRDEPEELAFDFKSEAINKIECEADTDTEETLQDTESTQLILEGTSLDVWISVEDKTKLEEQEKLKDITVVEKSSDFFEQPCVAKPPDLGRSSSDSQSMERLSLGNSLDMKYIDESGDSSHKSDTQLLQELKKNKAIQDVLEEAEAEEAELQELKKNKVMLEEAEAEEFEKKDKVIQEVLEEAEEIEQTLVRITSEEESLTEVSDIKGGEQDLNLLGVSSAHRDALMRLSIERSRSEDTGSWMTVECDEYIGASSFEYDNAPLETPEKIRTPEKEEVVKFEELEQEENHNLLTTHPKLNKMELLKRSSDQSRSSDTTGSWTSGEKDLSPGKTGDESSLSSLGRGVAKDPSPELEAPRSPRSPRSPRICVLGRAFTIDEDSQMFADSSSEDKKKPYPFEEKWSNDSELTQRLHRKITKKLSSSDKNSFSSIEDSFSERKKNGLCSIDRLSAESRNSLDTESSSGSLGIAARQLLEPSCTWKRFPLESNSASSSLEEIGPDQDLDMYNQEYFLSRDAYGDITTLQDVHKFDPDATPTRETIDDDLEKYNYAVDASMSGVEPLTGFSTSFLSRTLSRISERSTNSEKTSVDEESTKTSTQSDSLNEESLGSNSFSSDPPSNAHGSENNKKSLALVAKHSKIASVAEKPELEEHVPNISNLLQRQISDDRRTSAEMADLSIDDIEIITSERGLKLRRQNSDDTIIDEEPAEKRSSGSSEEWPLPEIPQQKPLMALHETPSSDNSQLTTQLFQPPLPLANIPRVFGLRGSLKSQDSEQWPSPPSSVAEPHIVEKIETHYITPPEEACKVVVDSVSTYDNDSNSFSDEYKTSELEEKTHTYENVATDQISESISESLSVGPSGVKIVLGGNNSGGSNSEELNLSNLNDDVFTDTLDAGSKNELRPPTVMRRSTTSDDSSHSGKHNSGSGKSPPRKGSHSSYSEEDATSSVGTTLEDGTVRYALHPTKCTHSSHSEDTSIALSLSEWSSSTNTVKFQNLSTSNSGKSSGLKSDDNSLTDIAHSISEWSSSNSNTLKAQSLQFQKLSSSTGDSSTLTEILPTISDWSSSDSKTLVPQPFYQPPVEKKEPEPKFLTRSTERPVVIPPQILSDERSTESSSLEQSTVHTQRVQKQKASPLKLSKCSPYYSSSLSSESTPMSIPAMSKTATIPLTRTHRKNIFHPRSPPSENDSTSSMESPKCKSEPRDRRGYRKRKHTPQKRHKTNESYFYPDQETCEYNEYIRNRSLEELGTRYQYLENLEEGYFPDGDSQSGSDIFRMEREDEDKYEPEGFDVSSIPPPLIEDDFEIDKPDQI